MKRPRRPEPRLRIVVNGTTVADMPFRTARAIAVYNGKGAYTVEIDGESPYVLACGRLVYEEPCT